LSTKNQTKLVKTLYQSKFEEAIKNQISSNYGIPEHKLKKFLESIFDFEQNNLTLENSM
jgi:hypothetical protein